MLATWLPRLGAALLSLRRDATTTLELPGLDASRWWSYRHGDTAHESLEIPPPFEVGRGDPSGTFMLACLDGEGVVLADGQWKRIRAGQACLLPPFVMNALKCLPKKLWTFAWVRYLESRETGPIVSFLSPVSG